MRKWEDVYVWLKQLVPGMRLSRIKTLSALVAGAMRMRGVGVLSLGRAMSGPTAAKHRIKRVWRFFRNPAVESLEVSKALFERIMPRKGSIVILCDWTDIDPFQQLVFSLPRDGRSLPFLSLTILKAQGEGSMVAAEKKGLAYLKAICPAGREIVLIADRGFGNSRWLTDVTRHGWHFVQRIAGNIYLSTPDYEGLGSALPVRNGGPSKDWGRGRMTHDHPFPIRLVTIYERGFKEPWLLVTDLDNVPAEIVRLYKRRMWIECTFRDLKNRNWGMGLSATRLSEPARHDRLFIVLAVAYMLLTAFGSVAEANRQIGSECRPFEPKYHGTTTLLDFV